MPSFFRQHWKTLVIAAITSATVSGVITAVGRILVADDDRVEFGALVVAIVAFIVGLYQYRRTTEQRRAEWLDQLAQRFYEQPNYKRIRRLLDYEEQPQLANLKAAILDAKTDESRTLMEALVDYLNFFEHLGVLEKMKQLTRVEIEDMFGYYLDLIRKRSFLYSYVSQSDQSFEQLVRLLQEPSTRTTDTA